MSTMTKFLRLLALAGSVAIAPLVAHAAGELHLDKAPVKFDQASLQSGAKLFVNYCLNCHSAHGLRYNKLVDIGLTPQLIQDNLMFTSDKIGDQMTIAMRYGDAKTWFGVTPPDLTLVARARASEFGSGPDWLYTYLRSFYRDDTRPTGWNNVIFPAAAMPHALWELQGEQVATFGPDGTTVTSLTLAKPGKMSKDEYDENVANLVSFITWMGEPARQARHVIGWYVLAVLAVLAVLTYLLKRAFWKDVH